MTPGEYQDLIDAEAAPTGESPGAGQDPARR